MMCLIVIFLVEMVDFWAALVKIKVKLRVSRSGITKAEKYILIFIAFLALVVFAGIQVFGPGNLQRFSEQMKFLFIGIASLALALRSAVVIFFLHQEISHMGKSKTSATGSHHYSLWPLRLKFLMFFVVLLAFSIFAFYWIEPYKMDMTDYIPPPRTSNRSNTFWIPDAFYLYCVGAFSIFLQFTSITNICRKYGSSNGSSGRVDGKNSVSPGESNLSSNPANTEISGNTHVLALSMKDIISTDQVAPPTLNDSR